MAIDPKYIQVGSAFFDTTDGSGPYAIDSNGNATLMAGGGGGAPGPTLDLDFSEDDYGVATYEDVVTLLSDILAEMQAQRALLQTIADNSGA